MWPPPTVPSLASSALIVALTATAPTTSVQGQEPESTTPAVVVEGDASAVLVDALSVALEPWGVVVIRAVRDEAAAARVRVLGVGARRLRVEVEPEGGALLAREMPLPLPLDEPSAASVALTVKTLLRNTRVAPPEERVAAEPVTETPTAADDAAATDPVEEPADAPPDTDRPPRASLDLGVGTRLGAFDGPDVALAELRFELGASVWPLDDGTNAVDPLGPLGLGIELAGGVPAGTEADGIEARWTTTSVVGRVSGRWAPTHWLRVQGDIGLGVRIAALRVRAVGSADATPPVARDRVRRADPLVRVRLGPEVALGANTALGLRLGAAFPIRRQRYEVAGQGLVRERAAAFEGSLVFSAFFARR